MLPKIQNVKWLQYWITPGGTTDPTNSEVLDKIKSAYPALQVSFPQISGFYAGTLLKKPLRWSPISMPYLKSINGGGFTVDGFASNRDGTLYWILTNIERPEYDALLTISSSRIRYLVEFGLLISRGSLTVLASRSRLLTYFQSVVTVPKCLLQL